MFRCVRDRDPDSMHGETLIFVYFFNLYFELDQCGGYTLQKQFSSQAKAQFKYYLNVNLIELSYEESRLYFGHVFFLIWDKMYADFWGADKYFYLIWTIKFTNIVFILTMFFHKL